EQIRQFLTSWYTCVLRHTSIPLAIRQERDLFYATLTTNPYLHKLAVNPLLLTVMTALHRYERLPDKRVLIYEKYTDHLTSNKTGSKIVLTTYSYCLHRHRERRKKPVSLIESPHHCIKFAACAIIRLV